eukprot:6142463-Pyramimonas_sp.AAC.1
MARWGTATRTTSRCCGIQLGECRWTLWRPTVCWRSRCGGPTPGASPWTWRTPGRGAAPIRTGS